MKNHHLVITGCILTLSMLITACTSKPSFPPPSVILRAPMQVSSSSKAASSAGPVASQPPSLLIDVPFAPQSPYANWDQLHEEACEEMSLLMVHHFLQSTPLSLADAEMQVQQMVAWERQQGYADDVSVAQLGAIATSLYGYHARVLTDVTPQHLRRELAAGHPIIIPAAGRSLKNPYFSGAGPFYHMLVITGYTDDGFITNDPGTKRGEQYWYSTNVLMNALHDWTGVKEEIVKGAKTALVVDR